MLIQFNELTIVSNSSKRTIDILRRLNSRLDDTDKREFLEWLKIVKQKQNDNKKFNKFF